MWVGNILLFKKKKKKYCPCHVGYQMLVVVLFSKQDLCKPVFSKKIKNKIKLFNTKIFSMMSCLVMASLL